MNETAIHVHPAGDDGNPGTAARPLRTVQAAVAARRLAAPGAGARIVLQPGLYPDTNVLLGPEDSGLTLEGAGPGEAILCGGAFVRGWAPAGAGWLSAPAPAGVRADAPLDALLVGGEFAPQARLPRRGALTHESVFPVRWLSSSAGGWERKPTADELMHLRCREGDLPADFRVRSARVQLFHQWDESRVGCAAYDPARRVVTFAQAPGHPPGAFAEHGDNPKARTYVVWNVPEGMHEPGQWWHDADRNRIVYWPRPHEDMAALAVIAPAHEGVLTLRGRKDAPVREVTVRNLAVIAGAGGTGPGGFGAGAIAGAIELFDVHGAVLDGLHLHHTAGAGIRGGGVAGLRIRRCHIHRTGGPGVRVDLTRDGVVEDCTIEDSGLIHESSLALSLCGDDAVIRHNLVRRCPYTAIQSAGGAGVVIEHNRLEDFMLKLDDGAAIYVFGGKGAVCRGNVAYGASGRIGHAYYLDEQCEDCRVEGNLAVDTASPVHNHMGRRCTHRHNVFLDRGDMSLSWYRCRDFVFQDNILQAGGTIVFHAEPESLARLAGNVIHAARGPVRVARLGPDGYSEQARTAMAPDAANRRTDPGLAGVAHERLRLAPGGAAAALGLPAPDFSRAGPRPAEPGPAG